MTLGSFIACTVLGFITGLITSIFFLPFTWQYWVVTFVVCIACIAVDIIFFKKKEPTEIPNEGK